MNLVELDPRVILWPEIRVTAYYQEGQEEMLKANLAVMGQRQPIVVVKMGDTYIGTDGLHRCQASIERGDDTIPCVVTEGDERDALLNNLVLNSLRGRTKASEQVAVMGELFDSMGVTREELSRRTGHPRAWVDMMLAVSQAAPVVRSFLDQEMITLGHAYAISKVKDPLLQEQVCMWQLVNRVSVKDLEHYIRTVVNPQPASEPPAQPPPTVVPRAEPCAFCRLLADSASISHVTVCASCARLLHDVLNLGARPTAYEEEES